MSETDEQKFESTLDTLLWGLDQYVPSEQCAKSIEDVSGVRCNVGQKTSRVVNKLCKLFGVDEHPKYNTVFAQLADALNPLSIPRTALLSVHPCDYLEMSNVRNSWSSCHNLEDGCYRAGTLSYLGDPSSMIFYTMALDWEEDTYKAPKVTREVFCYHAGTLLQSRLYPEPDDTETMTVYRNIVQQAIAQCLDMPNLWVLKREGVSCYIKTCPDALHYEDYSYNCYHPNVSLLQSVYSESSGCIPIGSTPYCLCCSSRIKNEDTLYCPSCAGDLTCAACGRSISDDDDAYWIDDDAYCGNCVDVCDLCGECTAHGVTTVIALNGNRVFACEDCVNDRTSCCDECGTRYVDEALTEVGNTYLCPSCLNEQAEEVAS